jgi:RNA polymerase primary sigma factor
MEATQMENHDPNDPVAVYIREACSVEPLTKLEETRLFRELGHQGNLDEQRENATRRLVESQLMLVVRIAQKHSTAGVSKLELIEEGNIGLIKAVRSFAEGPGGDFTTQAAACIEEAIEKYLGELK